MTRESDVGERFLLLAEDESAPMPMDQGSALGAGVFGIVALQLLPRRLSLPP
ncbi:hypothetical protein OE88DRAFT_1667424 [Heliocybe sulcata]|uniref:Uncharacterized protein n=1 Tax=Heliocybe sulcata TaxID=5364 RepID=A0A5C3MPP9_9AGAM|nr:hypothetical protein OE88DRAFT_1667424 [Heliocybe sulcata]